MLRESARVVAVDREGVWVEARQRGHCGGCAAAGTCGHALLDRLRPGRSRPAIAVPAGAAKRRAPRPGEQVTVGIDENLLLRLALLYYLVPLSGLVGASLLAVLAGAGEGASIGVGLGGLVLGFVAASRLLRRSGAGSEAQLLRLSMAEDSQGMQR